MIAAGIDVGTNTVRMIIAEVEAGQIKRELYSGRGITRLGAGLSETGILCAESVAKTLDLFKSFHEKIVEYGAEEVLAVATSAVREASNSAEFLNAAEKAGIRVKTIPGDEEAYYTYLGALSNWDNVPRRTLIYDIGGGSTEFIYVEDGQIVRNISLPLGVVKLSDRFRFDRAVDGDTLRQCADYIRDGLTGQLGDIMRLGTGAELLGTAGTVTTIAAVEIKQAQYDPPALAGHILKTGGLRELLSCFAPLTPEERLCFPGLEKGREDLMIGGIVFVLVIMEIFGTERSRIAVRGLREGLVIHLARQV